MKIIVVDNSPIERAAAKKVLEQAGHEIALCREYKEIEHLLLSKNKPKTEKPFTSFDILLADADLDVPMMKLGGISYLGAKTIVGPFILLLAKHLGVTRVGILTKVNHSNTTSGIMHGAKKCEDKPFRLDNIIFLIGSLSAYTNKYTYHSSKQGVYISLTVKNWAEAAEILIKEKL